MSLSQEPLVSTLQNEFVCGVKDITGEPYAGKSGIHNTYGNAVQTSNGAGPHNIQMFALAPDGTVLHCLLGYWNPVDLVYELHFAQRLNSVWQDKNLSRGQKDEAFRQMHLAHVNEHGRAMSRRSQMQGFDQQFEARNRLQETDTIKNKSLVQTALDQGAMHVPPGAFKTTDEIIHERMAKRPFVPYERFDVAAYSDYGRPFYDKNENERDAHLENIRSGQWRGGGSPGWNGGPGGGPAGSGNGRSRARGGRSGDTGVRSYSW